MLKKIREYIKTIQQLHWERVKAEQRVKELAQRFPDGCLFEAGATVDDDTKLGDHVRVSANTKLRNCQVGRGTYFSRDSVFTNCRIGAFCSIASDIEIGLPQHPVKNYVSTYPGFYSKHDWAATLRYAETDFDETARETIIGNDVWIGMGVAIPGGVTIGDGAIIAAGAVVTKDIGPYSIVGGIPARLIKKRFSDEHIQFLLTLTWWDKSDKWIAENARLFADVQKLYEVTQ